MPLPVVCRYRFRLMRHYFPFVRDKQSKFRPPPLYPSCPLAPRGPKSLNSTNCLHPWTLNSTDFQKSSCLYNALIISSSNNDKNTSLTFSVTSAYPKSADMHSICLLLNILSTTQVQKQTLFWQVLTSWSSYLHLYDLSNATYTSNSEVSSQLTILVVICALVWPFQCYLHFKFRGF